MDKATATTIIADVKDISDDTELTVTLTDGTEVSGLPISVNSKGVNLKVDGKTRSFGLNRVVSLVIDGEDSDEVNEDDELEDVRTRLEEIADEVSEGATTAEVAALLSDVLERELTPKELRVHLRALGLGVGKGRKYALSAGELRAVHNLITEADAAAATAN